MFIISSHQNYVPDPHWWWNGIHYELYQVITVIVSWYEKFKTHTQLDLKWNLRYCSRNTLKHVNALFFKTAFGVYILCPEEFGLSVDLSDAENQQKKIQLMKKKDELTEAIKECNKNFDTISKKKDFLKSKWYL